MAPSQREPPLPFAVWPWGLFPAALQPVWVQDINHGSPLHPLLLVVPDDRMILMEWTDFWKTNSLKSHPWAGSPSFSFNLKTWATSPSNSGIATALCHAGWSCTKYGIVSKLSMFTMQMLLLRRQSCYMLFAEHLSHLYCSITCLPFMQLIQKWGNTMTQKPFVLSSSLWDSLTCLSDFLPCLLLPKPQFQVSCSKFYLHWENWWCYNISFWPEQAWSRRQVN